MSIPPSDPPIPPPAVGETMTSMLVSTWSPPSHSNDGWSAMDATANLTYSSSLDRSSYGYASSESESRHTSGHAAKKRASRAGTRSVTTLSPAQLERKRANDREAQRAIRQRTKGHIETLERSISELRSANEVSERAALIAHQRNREFEQENAFLRDKLRELGYRDMLQPPGQRSSDPAPFGSHSASPAKPAAPASLPRKESTPSPAMSINTSKSSNSRPEQWVQKLPTHPPRGMPNVIAPPPPPPVTPRSSNEISNMADWRPLEQPAGNAHTLSPSMSDQSHHSPPIPIISYTTNRAEQQQWAQPTQAYAALDPQGLQQYDVSLQPPPSRQQYNNFDAQSYTSSPPSHPQRTYHHPATAQPRPYHQQPSAPPQPYHQNATQTQGFSSQQTQQQQQQHQQQPTPQPEYPAAVANPVDFPAISPSTYLPQYGSPTSLPQMSQVTALANPDYSVHQPMQVVHSQPSMPPNPDYAMHPPPQILHPSPQAPAYASQHSSPAAPGYAPQHSQQLQPHYHPQSQHPQSQQQTVPPQQHIPVSAAGGGRMHPPPLPASMPPYPPHDHPSHPSTPVNPQVYPSHQPSDQPPYAPQTAGMQAPGSQPQRWN